MQRVCFVLHVRPERLEEYKDRHRDVWPEMLDALRETGWRNYSLFLRADGLLVGYLETEDFERARRQMSKREVNDRWQREMSEFFVNSPGLTPDRAMHPLEEVFHLNGDNVSSES
jgi:L-rhamnose mutarotase